MCKPFVKWVGGKRQLVEELLKRMPKKYNRYFEPFVGGGALFWAVKPKDALISDYNRELICLYTVVREYPEELLEDLKKHKNTLEYFNKIRAIDREPKKYSKLTDIERASRFLYLNKSGYNGLYRVNKNNQFNVPFGKYKNPQYADEDNILACSKLLKKTKIISGSFEHIKEYIKKGDFIYFDPPYVPINKTASFTSYTDKGFDFDMQIKLKELCDYIDSIGAYFMLSNSHTKYIDDLYKDYFIDIVKANRAVNCNPNKRGKVEEVIIRNYKS